MSPFDLDSFAPLRLAVTYRDLRGISEFVDKTILAIKAPPDTLLKCDIQDVRLQCMHVHRNMLCVCVVVCVQSCEKRLGSCCCGGFEGK